MCLKGDWYSGLLHPQDLETDGKPFYNKILQLYQKPCVNWLTAHFIHLKGHLGFKNSYTLGQCNSTNSGFFMKALREGKLFPAAPSPFSFFSAYPK